MKNLLFVFCVLLFFSSCSKRKNKKQNVNPPIHFKWHHFKIAGKKYPGLITIPVKIDTLKNTYTMLLDLGSPTNTFTGGTWNDIIQKYPYLKEKISKKDTSLTDIFPSLPDTNVTWFSGPVSMGDSSYNLKIQSGEFWPYFNNKGKLIGSIGVSQFKNNVLTIDFKNQTISIHNSLNYDKLANNYSFTKFSLEGENRIVLKLRIGNKTIHAEYDTGELFISILAIYQKEFNNLRSDSSSVDSLSWQPPHRKSKIYKSKLGKNIYLGNTKLNGRDDNVFYFPTSQKIYTRIAQRIAKNTNAKYIIGNKFFSDKKIIIDFNKHRFGVSKSSK